VISLSIIKKSILIITCCCTAIFLVSITKNIVQAEGNLGKKVIYLNQDQSINNTLFDNDKQVSPGDKLVKEFYINNNNKFKSSINSIAIEGRLSDDMGNIVDSNEAKYKDFFDNAIITFYCEGKELFNGTLEEFSKFDMSSENYIVISGNDSIQCTIEYKLNEAAGNSLMGMEYKFDIAFGYSEVDTIVQTGQMLDFGALILLGSLLCSIGSLIVIRKTKLYVKSA
jgi:hypothetical protein